MPDAPSRLRCEYLKDPLGIDERRPRLSWWVGDTRPAEIQTGYRLLAASSRDVLERDEGDLWDSGRRDTRATCNVEYEGSAKSGQRVWWKVRCFDSDGIGSSWSAPAHFEFGLLEREAWRARWIGAPVMGDRRTPVHVPALRRSFRIDKPVARARLYVTALGVFDVEINGQRAVDTELGPGWTDYRQRVAYQTFDVTRLLSAGENVIGALLGDGWFSGFLGHAQRQNYGDRPEFLAQLSIQFADWTHALIETDAAWRWQRSHIVASDVARGESVDARQRLGDWTRPGYDDAGWFPVDVAEHGKLVLSGCRAPPIRALATLEPVAAPERRRAPFGENRWIYDVGQNVVGRARVRLNAPRGTLVTVRYAQSLDALTGVAQDCDYYTTSGAPDGETFEPKFALHRFQYVEVSGQLGRDAALGLEAVVIGSDLADTGHFHSSDALLNQLQHGIRWSQRGGSLDAPLDGPQGTQPLGWTGDAQVFLRTAAYNRDVAAFYVKWIADVVDAMTADARVPPVAPVPPGQSVLGGDGGPAWSDAIVICPWSLYRFYGERRQLERYYPAMRAFVMGLETRYPDLIRTGPGLEARRGFGDWYVIDSAVHGSERFGTTPKDLIGTAFFCHSAKLLARSAGVLGKLADMEYFEELAQRVKVAFRRRFVTHDGLLVGETQTGYVLALRFGLLEAEERAQALRLLVADIDARGGRLSTGFVGLPLLLDVLTEAGRIDVAYRLLLSTSAPGWLYPATQGATTVWERWRAGEGEDAGESARNGRNHFAYGALGEWLYACCAGIELDPDPAPEKNAFRHALIRPRPPIGPGFPDGPPLDEVEAALDSVHGRYEVAWTIADLRFRLQVTVPANCSATVEMPNGERTEIAAGTHEFVQALEGGDGIPVLREVTELAS